MRAFLAVCEREIAERRLLFLIGLFGFAPFLLPLLPGSSRDAAELRAVGALVIAGVVSALLAAGLGASVLGRDLTERRLGFYFARPLPGWSIWAGKLAAALALCLGAGLLVLLPALLFEGATRAALAANPGWLLAGVAIPVALVLLANLLSVMARSRSPWLAFDCAALAAVVLLGANAAERLLRAGMGGGALGEPIQGLLQRALLVLAPLALLAALAGGAVQVVAGRTDLRRGHRLLSLTFWGLLLAGVLGLVGWSAWLVAATPGDLTRVARAEAAPAGDMLAVQGVAAHREGYAPLFLMDASSGRFSRLFTVPDWSERGPVLFSGDGRRAVWFEPQALLSRRPSAVLVHLDLTRPEARPVQTSLSFSERPRVAALSPDGRLFATLQGDRLTVEDVDAARLLATVPVAPGSFWQSRLQFLDGAHLRYFHTERPERPLGRGLRAIVVTDVDLATGRSQEIGRTPPVDDVAFYEVSPDGSHLLVHQPELRLGLFAARGGAPLAELRAGYVVSGFLSDGRVLAASLGNPRPFEGADPGIAGPANPAGPAKELKELVLLSAEGVEERRFPLPDSTLFRVGGQPIPGRLVIALREPGAGREHWESRLLDLATGSIAPLGHDLLPWGGLSRVPGSAGSRLFLRGGGQLVLLDPATGREKVVAGQPG
jgi:hypothetical protein